MKYKNRLSLASQEIESGTYHQIEMKLSATGLRCMLKKLK